MNSEKAMLCNSVPFKLFSFLSVRIREDPWFLSLTGGRPIQA